MHKNTKRSVCGWLAQFPLLADVVTTHSDSTKHQSFKSRHSDFLKCIYCYRLIFHSIIVDFLLVPSFKTPICCFDFIAQDSPGKGFSCGLVT